MREPTRTARPANVWQSQQLAIHEDERRNGSPAQQQNVSMQRSHTRQQLIVPPLRTPQAPFCPAAMSMKVPVGDVTVELVHATLPSLRRPQT